MPNIPAELTGTATASPKPTPASDFKWITIEEMENYEKQIMRRFTRRNKPDEAKLFFYKIIGMHPYQPGGVVCSEEQNLFQYEVQKYHRNKFTNVSKRDENANKVDSKENLQVDSHEMRRGRWVCVDPQASFFYDVREFLRDFEIDRE